MRLDKIVVGTDFSEASKSALETALNLARESKATLYILHVVEVPVAFDPYVPMDETFRELSNAAVEQLEAVGPGSGEEPFEVVRVVLTGGPVTSMVDFAAEKQADMIVVGTHGRAGISRLLLGSTAERLLRDAPCQVLVAKAKQ